MSLRTRLTLISAGAVIAVVIIVTLGAFAATAREVEAQADLFLKERAELLTAGPRRGGESEPGFGFNDRTPLQFIGRDGQVLQTIGADGPIPVTDIDRQAIAQNTTSEPHTVMFEDRPFRVITVAVDDEIGLMIARDMAEQVAVVDRLSTRLPLVGLAAAVFAGLLAWGAVGRSMKPLGALTEAAEQVAETQDFSVEFPTNTQGEIGRLTDSFRSMLAALSLSKDQQRRLIDDAGHELRTPLTSLRNNIGFLKRAPNVEQTQRQETLDDIEFELEELSDLVTELVSLATDDNQVTEPSTEIALGQLASAVAHRAHRRSGRDIKVVADESVTVTGQEGLMERAVSNLVSNAIKFSKGDVTVSVSEGRISVRDEGPGIADEDKPHVFDRFFRSESARTMPGSGLGLSIVAMAAARHGGEAFVEDADPGTVVGFTFAS